MATDDGHTVALPLTRRDAHNEIGDVLCDVLCDAEERGVSIDDTVDALLAKFTERPEVLAAAMPDNPLIFTLPGLLKRDGQLWRAGYEEGQKTFLEYPEQYAAAMGGTVRTGRIGRGMRRKHIITVPSPEVDGEGE